MGLSARIPANHFQRDDRVQDRIPRAIRYRHRAGAEDGIPRHPALLRNGRNAATWRHPAAGAKAQLKTQRRHSPSGPSCVSAGPHVGTNPDADFACVLLLLQHHVLVEASGHQDLVKIMQFLVDARRIGNSARHFGAQDFAIAMTQTGQPGPQGGNGNPEPRRYFLLVRRRRARTVHERFQFTQPLCLSLRGESFLHLFP